jgi:XTP/dITP diphosphohydrolase
LEIVAGNTGMRKLIFASRNQNKADEIQLLLKNNFEIISLSELSFAEELAETHETLEENAIEKANFIFNRFQTECFAEDSGLFIDALNGKPGAHSARYAGEEKNDKKNIAKVLSEMKNFENRNAYFKTVIALCENEEMKIFSGEVHGKITREIKGENGFGYDPVFQPDGFDITFAEMTISEKNNISHRAMAFEKLLFYLNRPIK